MEPTNPPSRAAYQRYIRWNKQPLARRRVGRLDVWFIRGLDDLAKRFVTVSKYGELENEVLRLNGWPFLSTKPSVTS